MKNTNFKTKFIARIMLLVLLLASVSSFTSCGVSPYYWEGHTHKEFANYIENYNSKHDLYVDTFISFDLDDNEEISKRIYWIFTLASSKAHSFAKKHGYLCDKHEDDFGYCILFYLKEYGESAYDYAYKIKCLFPDVDFNYSEDDNIKIVKLSEDSANSNNDNSHHDSYFEDLVGSLLRQTEEIYNYAYYYAVYVNDTKVCRINISSIDKANEEKLDEIIQMLSDSMVILNTAKFFWWRKNK